ncbi:MAG: 16S rRNA (cytosine(1402)-N(4))-methyltransferase RsmH [Deltaproteobacteria bacterium]|nr:MAG: 16S rRNA (cytosine(1402)-N(4))-methyltransferase RsmH [Deltaproteobacteria bacterium]
MDTFRHVSVMPREVVELLAPRPGGIYLDGTVGGGGHARLILDASGPDGRLVGLDRDPAALVAAGEALADFGRRVTLCRGSFAGLDAALDALDIDRVDGILLDLGVSSHQLDTPGRGFSFREEGPLDMRMDPSQAEDAAGLLARADADELKRIFREYGEERWAGRIAREIVRVRGEAPLTTTRQLADLVCRAVPGGYQPQRIHPATRVFQALRIAVNGELDALAAGLAAALRRLRPGGRLAVISFHSLEDRLVKQSFRAAATTCTCPPRLPVCVCGRRAEAKVLTPRGVRPAEAEIAANPRARSAVLRGVEKLVA